MIVIFLSQEQTTESDPEINLKKAPSWFNIAPKPEEIASSSAPASSKVLTEEEQKGKSPL